jgi:O-antigen/teichoic acid export membrane protein
VPIPRRIARNAAFSVTQVLVSGVTLFLLYRQLLILLGAPRLGVWSLVLAATSASRVSDLGFSVSVVKFVAQQLARRDEARARAVAETAILAAGAAVALLSLLLVPGLGWLLPRFVEAGAVPDALALVPWALLSLWLSVLGSIGQAGLDGCQRSDLRGLVVSGGHLLFFGLALLLVRPYGLLGLAYAQVAQGAATAVASWLLLRRQLPGLPRVPRHFDRAQFLEMVRYGASFQAVTMTWLFLDPITKFLISRFGGLGLVGYYEMANRMVMQLRSLLVTSNQVLVPVFAELKETSLDAVRAMYLRSYRLMAFLGLPFFALVVAAVPLVSWLWIGRLEPQFVGPAALLALGWGVNTLVGPAYFASMGSGDLRWNTASHVVTAVLNVALGWALGALLGGLGVVAGWALASVLGSLVVPLAFHRSHAVPLGELLPADLRPLAAVAVLLATLAWAFGAGLLGGTPGPAAAAGALGLFAVGTALPAWRHPLRARLVEAVLAAKAGRVEPV